MLAVLLGVTLGIIVLLALPVDLAFLLRKDDRFRLDVSVAWAFGLLSTELGKTSDQPTDLKAHPRKTRPTRPGAGKGKTRAAMAFLRSPGMPGRLARLARDIWRQFRVRRLDLHLTFGLEDPADTGRLFGVLAPMLTEAGRLSRLDLQVRPDFSQPTLALQSRGQIRLIPLAIIAVIFAFLLSPISWRAGAAAIKASKSA